MRHGKGILRAAAAETKAPSAQAHNTEAQAGQAQRGRLWAAAFQRETGKQPALTH